MSGLWTMETTPDYVEMVLWETDTLYFHISCYIDSMGYIVEETYDKKLDQTFFKVQNYWMRIR